MTYHVTIGSDNFFSVEETSILREAFPHHAVIVADGWLAPVQEDINGAEALGWIFLHFADAGMATSCELILRYALDALKHLANKSHQANDGLLITVNATDCSTTINVPRGQGVEVRVNVVKDMVEVLVAMGQMGAERDAKPLLVSTGDDANRVVFSGTNPFTDPDKVSDYDPATKTFGPEKPTG